jgi:hypothetical protein
MFGANTILLHNLGGEAKAGVENFMDGCHYDEQGLIRCSLCRSGQHEIQIVIWMDNLKLGIFVGFNPLRRGANWFIL